MGDLTELESSGSTKLIGSDASGNETTPISSTDDGEIKSSDTTLNAGLDVVLNLVAGTPQLLKVGASVKLDRKYITMEALDTNVVWGFTNSTQSFDLFKSQFFILPFGSDTSIWFDVKSGTGDVAIGEI